MSRNIDNLRFKVLVDVAKAVLLDLFATPPHVRHGGGEARFESRAYSLGFDLQISN